MFDTWLNPFALVYQWFQKMLKAEIFVIHCISFVLSKTKCELYTKTRANMYK